VSDGSPTDPYTPGAANSQRPTLHLCNATGGSSAADMDRFGGPRFPIGLVREDLPVVGVVDGLWQRLVVAWAARIGVRALVAFLPGDDQSAQPDTRCGDGGERMIRR
jgi:hypothetical protein